MTDNTEALPPLPKPFMRHWINAPFEDVELFTAEQMHDHVRAALAQRQQVPASSEVTEAAERLLTKLESPVVALEGVMWLAASEIAALRAALTAAKSCK